MKLLNICFTLLFVACTCLANAQITLLAEGKPFEEPKELVVQIIQLKNGNTFCFKNVKSLFSVEVYDSSFHLIADRKLKPSYMELHNGKSRTLFEMNGNVVIFRVNFEERIPTLTRVIINGMTGEIAEDNVVATMEETKVELAYDKTTYDEGYVPNFLIVQNPVNEHYSIIASKCYDADPLKQTEIINFDQFHKEISRAFLPMSDSFKYSYLLNAGYVSDNEIYLYWKEFNSSKTDKKFSVHDTYYNISESKFLTTRTEVQSGFSVFEKISREHGCIFFFGNKEVETKSKLLQSSFDQVFESTLSMIDTREKKYICTGKDISSRTLFSGKYPVFKGAVQDMFIHDNGNFSIMYEEITLERGSANSRALGTDTRLGDVVIAQFDKKGNLLSSSFIPKKHRYPETMYSPMYNLRSENYPKAKSEDGHEYKYGQYVNAGKGYFLMNDLESNEEGKTKAVFGIQECHGFYFDMEHPARRFLFGKPLSNRENHIGLFSVWNYDKRRRILCTLELKMKGRNDKEMSLAWFNVE